MPRREFNPDTPYEALGFTAERYPELVAGKTNILLLHPRPHYLALKIFAPGATTCLTPERGDCDRLSQRGYRVIQEPEAGKQYDLCVAFPGESRDETYYLLALGAQLLSAGGTLVVAMSNDLGASRFEDKLSELMGEVLSQSKHHSRVFWAKKDQVDAALQAQWLALGAVREIPELGLFSAPGLFSWNKPDAGSKLLAESLPAELPGMVADLGCGYGYLSHAVLKRSTPPATLELFDSDARAIAAAKKNLLAWSKNYPITFHWQDVRGELPTDRFDTIIMNPPFHEHGVLNVDLGKRFFRAAHSMLKPGGALFAVVNRHLPYDETVWANFPNWSEIAKAQGYRVLRCVK